MNLIHLGQFQDGILILYPRGDLTLDRCLLVLYAIDQASCQIPVDWSRFLWNLIKLEVVSRQMILG